jgi:3-oxoacyl-[acyl-carrier protein] reductase
MKLLAGKSVIVTGAARNRRSHCMKMAEEGANVAFSYVAKAVKAKALEQKINALG